MSPTTSRARGGHEAGGCAWLPSVAALRGQLVQSLLIACVGKRPQIGVSLRVEGIEIGPYEYLYLVENAREGGRHVQRVIKSPCANSRARRANHASLYFFGSAGTCPLHVGAGQVGVDQVGAGQVQRRISQALSTTLSRKPMNPNLMTLRIVRSP